MKFKLKPEKTKKKRLVIMDNSLLSIRLVQVVLLVLTAIASYFGKTTLEIILFFAFAIGFISRIWTKVSAKNLSAEIVAERHAFFPDETGIINFKVSNDKSFGVPWVEFQLPVEKPIVICPVSGISTIENEITGLENFAIRTGRVKAFESMTYNTTWTAKQRGVTNLRKMKITTGDGFSLCSLEIEPKHSSSRDLVVYPRIVEVNIETFTQFQWEGEHHPKGVLEDPTVIKLTRPYEDSDSFKNINWRMAARNQELTVNQYEHIRPDKCHFIFDGQSFDGEERHSDELEDTLSILASITLKLEEWGMNTGYSFPKSKKSNPITIMAEKNCTSEVLFAMAAYQFRDPVLIYADNIYSYEDSIFKDDILTATYNETGRIYFVTYDEESTKKSLFLKEINESNITVLTYSKLAKLKNEKQI